MDLCIAVIVGRLTRDAELKFTPSGSAICKFAVATSTRRKKGDEWIDEPSFWDVELWGKTAESLNQYLTKGKQVAVEGTIRQDRWEQEGTQRMKVVINANSVQLLGGGDGKSGHSGTQEGQGEARHAGHTTDAPRGQQSAKAAIDADMFSDDIPF